MFSNEIKPFLSPKYSCEYCNYSSYKKSNMNNHFNSKKHESMIFKLNSNEIKPNQALKFMCKNCNKEYKDYSGLWRHNKKCYIQNTIIEKDEDKKGELIDYLMKENKEIKELILEIIKKDTHNTTNNTTHTNSHNKSFNLNFFLNETCKDAMNIMDFVDSIKIQLSDIEKVGELGYIDGISNIIIKNLKALDITKRPVHCTDKKRETMYVKNEDKWEKDEEQKTMRKVVRKVACKNQNSLQLFRDAHPDCGKYHSKFSDKYNKIIVESMGGSGDNETEKEEKIIKKISKEIVVDK